MYSKPYLIILGLLGLAGSLSIAPGAYAATQDPADHFPWLTGEFVGSLAKETSDGSLESFQVSASVTTVKKNRYRISVKDETGLLVETIEYKQKNKVNILSGLSIYSDSIRYPVGDSGCTTLSSPLASELCIVDGHFTLKANPDAGTEHYAYDLELQVPDNAPAPLPKNEIPRRYSMEEAMKFAMTHNFDSRIEFEHRIQAHVASRQAHLNLLPHMNFNSVTAVITGDEMGLIGSIEGLLPFLFPSRWAQAAVAKQRSLAENDVLQIMQLDTAYQVGTLAIQWNRDLQLMTVYKTTMAKATDIRKDLAARVALGQIEKEAVMDMDSIINRMQQDSVTLSEMLDSDATTFSQAMGFINPRAVTGIDLPAFSDRVDLKAIRKTEVDDFTTQALAASFELKEFDHLIDMAKANKVERYFDWMDPVGDPTLELGFGTGAAIHVMSSTIEEMKTTQEKMESVVRENIASYLDVLPKSIDLYTLSESGLGTQNDRLDHTLNLVKLGGNYDMFALLQIFQDYLAAQVTVVSNQAVLQTAAIQKARYVGSGIFAPTNMQPEKARVTN